MINGLFQRIPPVPSMISQVKNSFLKNKNGKFKRTTECEMLRCDAEKMINNNW